MCEGKSLLGIFGLFLVVVSSSMCHIQSNEPSSGGYRTKLYKRADDQNETSATNLPTESIKQNNKSTKKKISKEESKERRRIKNNAYHKQLSFKGLQK